MKKRENGSLYSVWVIFVLAKYTYIFILYYILYLFSLSFSLFIKTSLAFISSSSTIHRLRSLKVKATIASSWAVASRTAFFQFYSSLYSEKEKAHLRILSRDVLLSLLNSLNSTVSFPLFSFIIFSHSFFLPRRFHYYCYHCY